MADKNTADKSSKISNPNTTTQDGKKRKNRSEFQILQDDLNEMRKDGLLDNPSPTFMQKLTARIKSTLKSFVKDINKRQSKSFLTDFRRNFLLNKKQLKDRHYGIRAYKLKDLEPYFQKAYTRNMSYCLDLIKTNNTQLLAKLQNRFINWVTQADYRNKEDLLEATQLPKDRHTRFIVRDQSNKMSATMDNIIADRYEAIAFQWKTRNDNRVAGKPGGLYPIADDSSDKHGDHWSRRDKFYYYSNISSDIKKVLHLKKFAGNDKDLKDGMPGTPIGCRCYAKNYYFLEDLPSELVKDEFSKDVVKAEVKQDVDNVEKTKAQRNKNG